MIKEDRVTFEIAKLLRDKGFSQNTFEIDCNVCYKYNGNLCNNAKSISGVDREISYIAPTIQMVLKWLREVHNLFVFPFPQMNTNKFWTEIYQLSDNQEWENLYYESIDLQDYSTYEEACEAAIKFALEHLI